MRKLTITWILTVTLDKVEITGSIQTMNDMRQCLGRLYRVGQNPVVVTPPPTVEEQVIKRIESKIIMLGSSGPVEGLDLHKDSDNMESR